MSLQEIYTKVRTHLLTQKKRSMVDDSGGGVICAYRGTLGRKCAAGVLIPDEKYKESFEGRVVSDQEIARACGLNFTTNETTDAIGPEIDLVDALQRVHDTQDPSTWESCLDGYASAYGYVIEP